VKRFGVFVVAAVLTACFLSGCRPDPSGDREAHPLQANFTWNQQVEMVDATSCIPQAMVFHDVSVGEPESRLREFPDGTTSEEKAVRRDGDISGLVRLTVFRGTESDSMEEDVNPVTDC
jgi:hypothetical protein